MAGTRYAIIGDTHGDFLWTLKVLDHCKDLKISTVFQVGDWGFLWPGLTKPNDQIQALADALHARGQTMYFIDGNHDWHPKLRRKKVWPYNLHYQRRGTTRTFQNDDGKDVVVGFLGGATSIDKNSRIEGESWWPEEEILEAELPCDKVDVLITHDAPEFPHNMAETTLPLGLDYRCRQSRGLIQQAIRNTQPRRLFHGHYHWPYKGSHQGTEVIGLNCNGRTGGYVIVNHNFEEVTDRIAGWVTK